MIREMAQMSIKPGTQAAFEAAVREAQPLFQKSPGCHRVELHHLIEEPERYVLLVYWESLEAHIEGFRKSPAYTAWRALVSPYFAAAPVVVHTQVAHAFDAP